MHLQVTGRRRPGRPGDLPGHRGAPGCARARPRGCARDGERRHVRRPTLAAGHACRHGAARHDLPAPGAPVLHLCPHHRHACGRRGVAPARRGPSLRGRGPGRYHRDGAVRPPLSRHSTLTHGRAEDVGACPRGRPGSAATWSTSEVSPRAARRTPSTSCCCGSTLELPLPSYAHPGDAGADLVTAVDATVAPGPKGAADGHRHRPPDGLRRVRAPPVGSRGALRRGARQRAAEP